MEATHYSQVLTLTPEDNQRLFNLCGKYDEHIALIKQRLGLNIKQRGHTFWLSGERQAVEKACQIITDIFHLNHLASDTIPYQIHLRLQANSTAIKPHADKPTMQDEASMELHIKRGTITARGKNQINYLRQIAEKDINFGIGPAGTGKTYLTVACAVHALETGRVSRIVLVRPIVEAGEKLGFLPGDLAQKVHPYLQPLYDALYEMLGFAHVAQLIERGIIELVPLAYMRGRSLNDSFIILDEGQNTTIEQMKMFLTRIGFNSKAVVTGDITQIDLNNQRDSGLIHAMKVLSNVKGISFTHFQASDVVRHPLVQCIVEAYEKHNQHKKDHQPESK